MTGTGVPAEPVRLVFEQGPYAELLRAANVQYAADLGDAKLAHWLSVDHARKWQRRRAARSLAFAVAATLALAAAGVLLIWSVALPRRDVALAAPQHAAPARSASAELTAAAPKAEPAAQSLIVGETQLRDGSRVRVETGGAARFRPTAGATEIVIEAGKVGFEVAPQGQAQRFVVRAAAYRFSVLGTVFSVSSLAERVVLEVREGKVEVSRGDEVLATLGAGQHWASDASSAARGSGVRALEPPSAASSAATVAAPVPAAASASAVDCLAFAREKRSRDAEACFREQASKPGISGEMALFELARLRGDVLSDPAGALAALDEHRQRFPSGSLRGEVDVSHVELLARSGRRQEALLESAHLLETETGRERAVELRLLRGGIYRNGLKDLRSAEREYAAAERAGGARSGDAAYQRGACLEELGELEAARAAYRRYLAVPGRKREAEARSRLLELER